MGCPDEHNCLLMNSLVYMSDIYLLSPLLSVCRRRDIKNPRKRQRLRYESAQKKRQGMVQNIRTPDDVYGGEATGIKKNVSKSVRFK